METKKFYKDYTFEETKAFVEENKFKSPTEFSDKCQGLYNVATKNGWIKLLFNIRKPYSQYTFEEIKELAQKEGFTSRHDFGKKYFQLYMRANKMGWLDDIFPKRKQYINYTFEETKQLIEEQRIKSRLEFQKKFFQLYLISIENGWMDILFPDSILNRYNDMSLEEVKALIERENITSRTEFNKKYQYLHTCVRKKGWMDILFPNSVYINYKKNPNRAKPADITAFVKEFLANWDEALHYPNVILMKLAESFGDTSLLNKLVKKIVTTDPGSIERKELLEEMNEKMVENDDITCKEIEDIVKMSQEMEDNAVDDPITAMEKLMNIDDIEDNNGNISAESLGHQVDMAQRALNNKLIDDKNCGDIVLTIENVFLHRMLCLWADGDDNVTKKMFEKLFV